MFWFLGQEACGILVLQTRDQTHTTPALKDEALTIGQPGKSF